MSAVLKLSKGIDNVNKKIGKWLIWLVVVAVFISAGNAIVRKIFHTSSNAWLEAQWYLFGAVVLGCAAYTFQENRHIRIDILSSHMSQRYRDVIDLVGHVLFLIPLCFVMIRFGIPFFYDSLATSEVSMNAGGLVLWPAKALVPLGFLMLFAQAISETIKRIAVMRGLMEDPWKSEGDTH